MAMKSRTALKALVLGIVLAFLGVGPAQAQTADPDSLAIGKVFAYDGVIAADDLLVVAEYSLQYTTLPTDAITSTFLGRFTVSGVEQNATEIVPFNNGGYGLGVFSFYFTAAEKTAASIEFDNPNSEDYQVVFQGKPNAFPSNPPSVSIPNITYRPASDTRGFLFTDITGMASTLENDAAWAANLFDMVTFISGQQVLAPAGEDYFGQAVPNLQVMVPDLFSSSVTPVPLEERDFTFSERDRLQNFWQGRGVASSFQAGADLLNVDLIYFTSLLGMLFVVVIMVTMGGMAARFGATNSIEFGLLTCAITLPLAARWGLLSLTFVAIIAAVAALMLLFSLFLRRAG